MNHGYENEVTVAIEELKAAFELGRTINPAYTESQFVEVLSKALRKIDLKVNEIVRSGGHPTDEMRVQRFAHRDLIAELS